MEPKLRRVRIRYDENEEYTTRAFFHQWATDAIGDNVEPIPFTQGLIEHLDGRVEYVYPPYIKFEEPIEE